MATVTFDHVWKRYGDVVAVSDLNLDIRDEEFLVLVGPSGCGKTTSLRMIAGLEEISEGTLKIGDRVVNDLAPKDRDVAMVFQSYALYPHMSVRDNLAFGLKLRKVPKPEIERRVQEAAKILDLGNLLDRKPKQLSGGQRQRVALGRAIVREPAVFLMDEPLSNLDAKLRTQTRAQILRLHQRLETTFVYVTHDQTEAMTMGSRIAVMSAGLLQQVGPPQELYDHPVNKFVAGFIGSPAMNFLEMTVSRADGKVQLTSPEFSLPLPERLSASVAEIQGDRVTLGVRPEHLEVGEARANEVVVRATADVVEYLGDVEQIHLKVGEHEIIALVDSAARVRPGDVLDLRMPYDKIHLFDDASGLALQSRQLAAA